MIRLITGGARSGKSSFAESLYTNYKDVVYIATSIITDSEMEERITLHRERRPAIWRTYEGNDNLNQALGKEKHYLLDCITVLLSNIMFDMTKDVEYIPYELQRKIEGRVLKELKNLIEEVNKKEYVLTVVTNEVGYGIVPDNHVARVFRDLQGRINQELGKLADEVYLVCCGVPVKIK
ncbi:MAG: bifunctional adenosylcobinamide kinase/adenosylcobinamide-phosphate guanylyltransferase [Epulopiscium sp.]|nr:bifunctional adenosylcobinamide kinase/adenosylcobinamide-phosphate guanylyltransferase [Candidatus Epulonipiscium sp.]